MKINTAEFKKPQLNIIVKEGEKHLWDKLKHHHYMDHNLPNSSVFYTFYWLKDKQEILIGCAGILFQIAKNYKARRFTRIVVSPEYQGLGFGSKIINSLGKYYKDNGIDKVFLGTFHPRLGEYMRSSDYWTPSANNLKEFNLNEQVTIDKNTIKNLRDGVSMYRYNFIGWFKYNLLYNPILLIKLRNELKELKKTGPIKAYEAKLKEYNSTPKQPLPPEPIPEELLITSRSHIKAKEEHNKMFKKSKRKPLTSAERKAAKLKLKEQNEANN